MSTSNKSIPSLCSCTPGQVSKYLLDHRFQGDAKEAATFLLQSIEALPNIDEINEALTQEVSQAEIEISTSTSTSTSNDESDNESDNNDLGSVVENIHIESPTAITVSATVPRSKFTLEMHERGCVFTNSKNDQISIHCDSVKHIIMFPKREDCLKFPKRSKKPTGEVMIPGSMVLLILEEEGRITFRQKTLTQLCFQLPSHQSDPIIINESITNQEDLTNTEFRNLIVDSFEERWKDVFTSSLDVKEVTKVYNPKLHTISDSVTFLSDQGDANTSIMQGGMPFIKCYSGVNDGVLYPLEEGLLFFKPPKFIHRSELHSIACGRGSGGRFVDLVATLDNGSNDDVDGEENENENKNKESVEFSNINREEVQCLNNYIHNVLIKAMARDAAQDTDDDDHQSDVTIDSTDVVVVESKKRKSRRSASVDARRATKVQMQSTVSDGESDDDDDDDFNEMGSRNEDEDQYDSEMADDDDNNDDDDESNSEEGTDPEDDDQNDVTTDSADVVVNSRKRKSQRSASVDARKSTKVQLQSTASDGESEDDDEDFNEIANLDGDESNPEEGTDTESEGED